MPKTSDKAWREARRKALRQLATTTDAEDAEIRAGIAQDPNAFQLTDEMWARMRPATLTRPAERASATSNNPCLLCDNEWERRGCGRGEIGTELD